MTRTILVVDDSSVAADSFAGALQDHGYAVYVAADGLEAIAALELVAVDLVLSDVRMPRMDGEALVAELRRRGSAVPVVLMSGVVPSAPDLGMVFLRKPIGIDELIAAVDAVLGPPIRRQLARDYGPVGQEQGG